MSELMNALLTRRSCSVRNMTGPGPTPDELEQILRAGIRVPDHGKLGPWRFVILRGDAREAFGEVLAAAYKKANPDAIAELLEVEAERFQRAPVVVAVISRPVPSHKIPEWEQILSCGAVCQNLLHAANALGYGAQWLTEWPAYNDDVKAALGLEPGDRIVGFVYFGTAKEKPEERVRPALEDVVSEWTESS